MSHFCVLVTGTDVDDQLAPFDENLAVDPYRIYLAEAEWHYFDCAPGAPAAEVAAKWNTEWQTDTFGADDHGLYETRVMNPDGKWDWYEVGGRWAGFFRVKPGIVPTPPNFSWGWDEQDKAKYVGTHTDRARKGDIDFEFMHAEAYWEADAQWVAYDALRQAHPAYRSFADIFATLQAEAVAIDGDLEGDRLAQCRHQARVAYGEQPRVQACTGVVSAPFLQDIDEYFGTDRAAFAARTAASMFTPYAVLHDGEWHAQGDMGWFGTSRDIHTADEWRTFVTTLLDKLDDDTVLTIVDCHV